MVKPFLTLSSGGDFKLRRRRSGWIKSLLFGLVVLAFAAAAAEWIARFCVAQWGAPETKLTVQQWRRAAEGAPQMFVPAPFVHYRLNPGFVGLGGGGTRINAQGFRDDFDYEEKTSGTLRIVCLGGSTTFGSAVRENREAYPAALGRALNAAAAPEGWSRIEVMNLGVGGYTSAEVLANLDRFGVPLKPDAAIIEIAINDINPRFYSDFDASYESFRKPMEPLEIGAIDGWLDRSTLYVVAAWKLGWIPALTLQGRTQRPLPPADEALANLKRNGTECFRNNLKACVELAKRNGIQPWLATEAYNEDPKFLPADDNGRKLESGYRLGLAQHNQAIRDLAEAEEAGLIDLDRLLPRDSALYADPIHLTAAGYAIQARIMAKELEGKLPRAGGSVAKTETISTTTTVAPANSR